MCFPPEHRTARQGGLQIQQHPRRVFERFLDRDERQHRFAAIDDPMIVRLREIVDRPHDDLSVLDDRALARACTPRIADCGGLMIGVDSIEPNTPPLLIV
jgi:hypothetical protein